MDKARPGFGRTGELADFLELHCQAQTRLSLSAAIAAHEFEEDGSVWNCHFCLDDENTDCLLYTSDAADE